MNIFRLAGDMTHLLSIIVLLLKIRTTKSCAGISLKTQELYVIVFLTRYLDLFTRFHSFYNTIMKLVFIGTSLSIVWYMKFHKVVKQTYSKDQDNFRHYFFIVPCFLLALLVNHEFTVMELLWTFSLYVEAIAILPQLILLQRSKNIDNLTGKYIFLLGSYRAFYIINWIYRFFLENHQYHWIPWISGFVQTALYADFFYYYIKSWKSNESLKLPG
ncbi:ER lumen protein-retaining receptor-like [Ipomoea triloba]|uniref:ER lumen protein-retaining receptor-like n=1 Tax=Ipomoea triloba TaxID=35885 RepID=UPI00125E2C61|nr:ER lumen protein-retaining receptor-like [Ipomoea triloba]